MAQLKNHSSRYWLNDGAAAAFNYMEDKQGFIDLNSAGRSVGEQNELIARWNRGGAANRPPNLYEPARPAEKSRHVMLGGIAFDTSEWRRVKEFCHLYGFKWYGNSDPVHFEYVGFNVPAGSTGGNFAHTGNIQFKQRQLNFLGFFVGAEDNQPGQQFRGGTFNFQNAFGLTPDKINGDNTGAKQTEIVKWVQNRLIVWGYPVGPHGADGDPGADTKSATKAFQLANGLEGDEIAGRGTRAKLEQNPPVKSNIPLGRNATSRPTREIQTFLISKGYDLGPWGADDEWGQFTGNAVYDWQGKNGLEQDSVWGTDSDNKAFGSTVTPPPVVTPPVTSTTNPNTPFVLPAEIIRYSAWSTNTPKGDKNAKGEVQPILYVPKSARKNLAVHWDGNATPKTEAEALSMLKGYEAYHMRTDGAGMIKYNFAINPVSGVIYEGRGFDMLAMAIGQNNTPNISVIVIGGKGNLTLAARNALRSLYKLNNVWLGRIAGQKVHSDFNATECPGDEIRTWVHAGGMVTLPEAPTTPVEPPVTPPVVSDGTTTIKNSVLEALIKEAAEIEKRAAAVQIAIKNLLGGK